MMQQQRPIICVLMRKMHAGDRDLIAPTRWAWPCRRTSCVDPHYKTVHVFPSIILLCVNLPPGLHAYALFIFLLLPSDPTCDPPLPSPILRVPSSKYPHQSMPHRNENTVRAHSSPNDLATPLALLRGALWRALKRGENVGPNPTANRSPMFLWKPVHEIAGC